jgi:hypothetical protein
MPKRVKGGIKTISGKRLRGEKIERATKFNASYRIDGRVAEAIRDIALRSGRTVNAYVQELLIAHAKAQGELPLDFVPQPDTRGGWREGAGRKKKETES